LCVAPPENHISTDGLRSFQNPAAGEHCEPTEKHSLRFAEQLIAPVERAAQRTMAV
jgi:hypothetical protein